MMTDNNKDDYVLTHFGIGEGMSASELDAFVHANKDKFYSKELAEYIDALPDVVDGITETGVYKNEARERWEYWAVTKAGIDQAGIFFPARDLVSWCKYSEKILGFNKWMQEMEHYLIQGAVLILPINKIN